MAFPYEGNIAEAIEPIDVVLSPSKLEQELDCTLQDLKIGTRLLIERPQLLGYRAGYAVNGIVLDINIHFGQPFYYIFAVSKPIIASTRQGGGLHKIPEAVGYAVKAVRSNRAVRRVAATAFVSSMISVGVRAAEQLATRPEIAYIVSQGSRFLSKFSS